MGSRKTPSEREKEWLEGSRIGPHPDAGIEGW
jgi:hypothetical protein